MKMSEHIICSRCLHQTVCRYVDLQIKNQITYDTIRIEVEKGNAPESILEELRAKGLLSCPYLMGEATCDGKQD